MENFFVPYEQTLVLKELGFDGECLGYYFYNGSFRKWVFNIDSEKDEYLETISAPLYQQAFKFFRDNYKMDSVIIRSFSMTNSYHYRIVINNNHDDIIENDIIPNRTYEEAELECLNKLIEIVKNKKYAKHTFNTNKKKK